MLASGFSDINTLDHSRQISRGWGVGYGATIALLALLASGGGAQAQQSVDPTTTGRAAILTPSIKPFMKFDLRAPGGQPGRGFPLFYQDQSAVPLALELCSAHSTANSVATNLCIYDPPLDTPYSQELGFGAEAFWWLGEATINIPGTRKGARLTMGVEAAFAGEVPIRGQEFTFGRIRIRAELPQPGTYEVVHPFGSETFIVDAAELEINATADLGSFDPDYTGARKSAVTQFLRWPAGSNPPSGYIGDPGTPHVVEGSPTGHNKFTIIYHGPLSPPTGWTKFNDEFDKPKSKIETDLFTVSGKIYDGPIPTPLTLRRASYNSSDSQLEIFAQATPGAEVVATVGTESVVLKGDDKGNFYTFHRIGAMPDNITLIAKDKKSGTEDTTLSVKVTDSVLIDYARYNPFTKILEVKAASTVPGTILTVSPNNIQLRADGTASILSLAVPPSRIKVTSSRDGWDILPVTIANENIKAKAECVTSKASWIITGTTTETVQNTIQVFKAATVTGNPVATGKVDASGNFTIGFSSQCSGAVSLRSAKGNKLENISIQIK
jgi:hypothetical protein